MSDKITGHNGEEEITVGLHVNYLPNDEEVTLEIPTGSGQAPAIVIRVGDSEEEDEDMAVVVYASFFDNKEDLAQMLEETASFIRLTEKTGE